MNVNGAKPSNGGKVLPNRQKEEELAARLERLPNSRFNLLILGVGVIAFLVEAMDTSIVAAVLGPLKEALHLTPGQLGTISVAAVLTTVIGILMVGPLADIYGRKKMLIIGVTIAEIFTCLTYFSNSFMSFFLLRLLTGLGLGFIFPITLTYLAEFVGSKHRAYYTGVCNGVLGLGYFMTMLISYVITPHYGYHVLFLMPGVLLVSIPYIIYMAPESPKWLVARGYITQAEAVVDKIEYQVRHWTKEELPPVSPIKSAFDETGKRCDIISRKYIRTTLALWVMFSMTFVVFYTRLLYMPLILSTQGIDLKNSLLFATIMNAAAIPGNLLAGVMMHIIGRRWTIAIYGILTGVFVIAFGFAKSQLALIIFGCGIFWFDTFAAQKMLINESYPTGARATGAAGAEFVARCIGGIMWAGFVPILLASWGANTLFILIGSASLFIIPVAMLMVRETRASVL